MLEKEKLIQLQGKFSNIHLNICILLLIFYPLFYFINGTVSKEHLVTCMILSGLLFFDFLFSKFQFFHSMAFVQITRMLLLFIFAILALIMNSYLLVTILLMFLYFVVLLELGILYDLTELFYRINLMIQAIVPILSVLAFDYIMVGTTNYEIIPILIFALIFCVVYYHMLQYIAAIMNQFFNRLYKQERLVINSKEDYENLKAYQEKLVHANEQLGVQKVQLEAANSKIVRNSSEMDIQYQILKLISRSLDIDELLDFITQSLIEYLKMDLCGIVLHMPEQQKYMYAVKTLKDQQLRTVILNSIESHEFLNEFPDVDTMIINNHVGVADYSFLMNSDIGSILFHPIQLEDKISGMMFVGKKSYDYFKDNLPFFNTIVEQLLIALNNAQMYLEMQDMAQKDALTGLYNRRYLMTQFPKYTEQALQNQSPLSVILFDIDKFKSVNDTYGHLFGDVVIHTCGSIALNTALKHQGFAARYGGEEFVILFPEKDVQTVHEIVQVMHEEIKNYELDYEGTPVHINVSIGITTYPTTCFQVQDLLQRADWSMYYSKKHGRGRITIDNPAVEAIEA